ncbi:3-oxoacyl-[acyl-carrier-protein] reductase [Pseudoxanthomonas sp. GM95]|uniref:acetoacetyl-CoA reductase n=1 Tax=Pseudoxanthomonas sp. GM95 TaxID=1881043 RepID=UPI0008B3E2E0|nr:acetoacetyl-CoA reductase [Pseudoxanthomonas sp. GM95]SEL01191.1 3-oxoacyl-[acyl-carrier-protein] reductase [Pseudoxanthomonas sp. GM95]
MTPRIALVTGGIGGLGTAICRALTDAGHTVVATDLPASAERLQAFTEATAGKVHFEPADVGDDAQCADLVARVQARFGALDVLVNNAGITRDATLRKMDMAQWNAVLQVNLTSAFQLCHHAIDGMIARGFGRIVNISSVSGQTGNFGQANYAAAKAGLHGLTMSLAREVASKGVTVNSVSPGYVRTPMTAAMPDAVLQKTQSAVPVGRLGEPADIARAVRFFCEEDAGYITGANLPVNGGLYMGF